MIKKKPVRKRGLAQDYWAFYPSHLGKGKLPKVEDELTRVRKAKIGIQTDPSARAEKREREPLLIECMLFLLPYSMFSTSIGKNMQTRIL